MNRIASTRPTLGLPLPAIISSSIVVAVIAGGLWIIAYGLPQGEAASWVVFTGAMLLLLAAIASWNHIDFRRVSLLQRSLIISALLHVLIAAGFSGVVVARSVARMVRQEPPMVPTVNVQLAREYEVRQQVRQQMTVSSVTPEVAAPRLHQPLESPLARTSDRIEPVGTPGLDLRQIAVAKNELAPTIPMAPPAAELAVPLLPVTPNLSPLPQSTPLPVPPAANASAALHVPGPLVERLAMATTPIPGRGAGTLGVPPAALPTGGETGGTLTGSGTGKPLSISALALPPRAAVSMGLVAPPPPSTPQVTAPALADPLPARAFDQRQRLLQKFGGSPETEAAVARALLYLSRVQHADGHWTKILGENDKATDAHDTALTGLAVLCYLAADHTPDKPGPYQDTVRKGLRYLHAAQKPDGDLRGDGNMYDHGIAALAVAEAAAMVPDRQLRTAAHRAAQFILDAQNRAGAWRYEPRDAFTDTSVTGWQVLALHSAERTGFVFPDAAKHKVGAFLDTVNTGRHGMLSGYLTPIATTTMTGEATFTRMLLGQRLSLEQLAEAAEFMLRKPPARDNLNYYYIYYASLAMMQMQGHVWQQWNATTSRLLIELQERQGAAGGSFPVAGEWANRAGRVYTTAMATLTLEIYYRYLPMYGRKNAER